MIAGEKRGKCTINILPRDPGPSSKGVNFAALDLGVIACHVPSCHDQEGAQGEYTTYVSVWTSRADPGRLRTRVTW